MPRKIAEHSNACRLAVLSGSREYHEEVGSRLAVYGLGARVVRQERVGRGLVSFWVTVLEPVPLPRQAARRAR